MFVKLDISKDKNAVECFTIYNENRVIQNIVNFFCLHKSYFVENEISKEGLKVVRHDTISIN